MKMLVLQTLAFGSLLQLQYPMLVAPSSCAVVLQVQQIQKRMTDLEKIVRTRNSTIEVGIILHSASRIQILLIIKSCMELWCKFVDIKSSMLQLGL